MTTGIDTVDLSIKHFIEAWRCMCAGAAEYADEAGDTVQYVFSGVPVPFFNVALVTGRNVDAAKLASTGQEACAWAAAREVPWLFIVTHETLAPGTDANAALETAGLVPLMPLTGMIAHEITPASRVPSSVQLARPQDDDRCSAIVEINSLAYGMDLDPSKVILGKQAFWEKQFPALGIVDHTPVASAAVLIVDGHRYVALVATNPAHQRRGYGEAVMRHALELAAHDHPGTSTTLHASEAGRPIYERMGYRPIATHTIFMEQRFLAGH